MTLATAHTVALQGALGHLIDVQADVSPGTPGTTLVGRPDASLNEARDRCRMAVSNSGAEWPSTRRVTILLSPSDLVKRGTHYDLAIALAVLAAVAEIPQRSLEGTLVIGELTLAGGLRCVPGVLPMVMAASRRGFSRVIVPEPQAREASMVPQMSVLGMRSLAQVRAELRGEVVPTADPVAPMSGSPLVEWRGSHRLQEHDLADLKGVADVKFALEVAAAGGHHLMLSGPKGSGKTSLAERLPGLLPDLSVEEALELTALHSLAGALEESDDLIVRPPFFAPHHDASKASLIGGGSGRVRPGEISRSHCGVLFLDEFPLFRGDVIDALRQPLENGEVTIARGEESATFPARGMVVTACNPCPCGDFSTNLPGSRCTCSAIQRQRYNRKVTGPIHDRIDILRHVLPPTKQEPTSLPGEAPESSAQVRERVTVARDRQHARYAACDWRLNSQVPSAMLAREWPLPDASAARLEGEVLEGRLSRRGAVRVHRVAWTVADLGGRPAPTVDDVDTAFRLRQGEPLMQASVVRRAS
ncbi:MAG TPA: YifB family Mg chelatase-like AAA ATPase [Nocardioides sp.]|jgi:magnesium chelatase family protein|uniref:YifB family Mg chelatase-like AAA ATPase n=1 Tax=Nocardioides sp. TaxID=35761 RepID=UPI002E30BBEB|nr:YifB family Mg chelatase-like AAA ATPase [Nocardioides sp.]HEX3931025.1 YifB family Mg chelatase-like AAA ATPase [Nocardioides sp.]